MLNHNRTSQSPYRKTQRQPSMNSFRRLSISLFGNSPSILKRISTTDMNAITSQLKQSQQKVKKTDKLKKLASLQTMEGTIYQNAFTAKNDLFPKHHIQKESKRHFHKAEQPYDTLSKQQRDELDYVTFRLIKHDEKTNKTHFKPNPPRQDSQQGQQ